MGNHIRGLGEDHVDEFQVLDWNLGFISLNGISILCIKSVLKPESVPSKLRMQFRIVSEPGP